MKVQWWSRRTSALFWLLLFAAYSVAAAGALVLDAMQGDFDGLSRVSDTTVQATEEMRNLGAAQMIAIHRARSGAPFTSLPPGTTVKIVWPDGSSEYVVVVNPAASDGVRPIPGTQHADTGAPADRDGLPAVDDRALPDTTQRASLPARDGAFMPVD